MRSRPTPCRWLTAGALLLAVAGTACHRAEPTGRYNVILISIDTLRADRLGAYGYDRNTSPNIDRWAESALVFESVVAESSWTLPSHVTLLSGLLPSNHSTVLPTLRPGDSVELLSEIFAKAHYRTFGLTDGGYMVPDHGFDRGFEVFNSREKTFDVATKRALKEIEDLDEGERFFLFLHTYDVHCPYDPSETFRAMFLSENAEFIETTGRCGNPHFNSEPLTAGQVRYLSDSYDASIRELDEHFGQFVDRLRSLGRLDDTVVILTSDHGEEFGEHGQIGHERTLFRESLMVPLIVSAPQLSPGRVDAQVGLVDVAPTAVKLAEVPSARAFDGQALLPDVGESHFSSSSPRISELSWQSALRSVMTAEWHLILNLETHQPLLFSNSTDAAETVDLTDSHDDVVSDLMKSLRQYQAALRPRTAEPIGEQDPEQLEQLRALGYIN